MFLGGGGFKALVSRDLYDVSCKEIDAIVDISRKTSGIHGARMTGGGFGGCVVALVSFAIEAPLT